MKTNKLLSIIKRELKLQEREIEEHGKRYKATKTERQKQKWLKHMHKRNCLKDVLEGSGFKICGECGEIK